jgi:hypothetical protein
MFEIILIYKLINIILYAIAYGILFKRLNKIEEKIVFYHFGILFFIGGSISCLIFDIKNIIFPSSGMLDIHISILSWSIYFIIVFLLPLLSIVIISKILKNNNKIEFKQTNMLIIIFLLFLIIIYVLFSLDINQILLNHFSSYKESLETRYSLQYDRMFYFIVKVLSFVLLLSLNIELLYRKKVKLLTLTFMVTTMLYMFIDNFIFISKLYFIEFVFSFLIVLSLYIKKKYLIIIMILFSSAYTVFYFYNIGNNYEANIIEPLLKGLTRFTITIPYYIEYYMNHDFDMRIYLHSIFIGENIISPNIKVFSLAFDTLNKGSLASGIYTYNYANFGIFTILKSLIEVIILIYLYKIILNKNLSSVKLALFCLLIFGIINYSFTTILMGSILGFIYFALFYFIKDTLIPQIIFKRKRINETTTTRS